MFTFHLLGFPHTATNRQYNACAYTQKIVRFIEMMAPRGHQIIHYGNEGSCVPHDPREPVGRLCDHVDVLTEAERASFFGPHDRQKLYDLKWVGSEPYWRLFNIRAIEKLKPRVKKGDFILTLAGADCHQAIGDVFPGSYAGEPQVAMMVEYGIGYYGTFSRYRVYESHSHREWCMGMRDCRGEDNDTAVVPNFFDLRDFVVDLDKIKGPRFGELEDWLKGRRYFLFIGRLISSKGIEIVDEMTQDLGVPIVFAGQGHVRIADGEGGDAFMFGHASIEERAALMAGATAVLCPTRFREPFGGTAVEAQLAGTPAITTDQGAFTETVRADWRCASHREFVEAGQRALELPRAERLLLQRIAQARFSLEAVAPQYERYFQRLLDRWGAGWYQETPYELDRTG